MLLLEVSIAVSATVTDPTEDVKAMSPERRKCLLESETSSSLYKVNHHSPHPWSETSYSWTVSKGLFWIQNCPLLTSLSNFQAIYFSKYTKSGCQLENNLKNLLDKFKYAGKCFLPLCHKCNFQMSALLLTKSTWLCDQEVRPRVQERRPNCLQVTPGLLQLNEKCPLSSDQLYNMKSAYEKNRYISRTQIKWCWNLLIFSARNTGLDDSMFIEPNSQDSVNCPDQCHSVAYSSQASTHSPSFQWDQCDF